MNLCVFYKYTWFNFFSKKKNFGPRKYYENPHNKKNFKQQKVYEKQERPQQQSPQPVREEPQAKPFEQFTIQILKEKINDFLGFPQEKQRTILGELLFPLVQKHVSHETLAPKITGMLIDFTVFEVTDIIEFLDNAEILHERVAEAEGLIQTN